MANSWNSYSDGLFRAAIKDYFTEGMTREQLAVRFAEDFAGLGERGAHYWELMADHTATKTRELGRVDGYRRAGIEYIRVRAELPFHMFADGWWRPVHSVQKRRR